jgi:hypothetical protein
MIAASGDIPHAKALEDVAGPGFKSRLSPYFCLILLYLLILGDAKPFAIDSRHFWQDWMRLRVLAVHNQAQKAEII